MAAARTARKNSDEKSAPRRGPKRDAKGRLSGGNPGNSGGKPGRSGRKPDWFKSLCEDILSDAATKKALRTAAQTPTTPGYGGLIKALAAYAAGVPVQRHAGADGESPIAHSVAVTVTRRIVRPNGKAAA